VGFSGTVNFSCSVTYNGSGNPHEAPTCSVTPSQVSVVSPSAVSTSLSISTTAPHVVMGYLNATHPQWLAFASSGSLGLAAVLAGVPRRKRSAKRLLRRIGPCALLIAICVGLLMLPSCGSSNGNNGNGDPGTSQGSYTVTVNATASGYTSSISIPATVQ
jgi:hypothetical protein